MGKTYIIDVYGAQQVLTSPYSDLVWESWWPKFLQKQREEALRDVKALYIQARFELGLPLQ